MFILWGGNVTVDASRHLANANHAVENPRTEDSNLVSFDFESFLFFKLLLHVLYGDLVVDY